jgi:hypothetical protein
MKLVKFVSLSMQKSLNLSLMQDKGTKNILRLKIADTISIAL